jgi:hypothetical protein
MPRLSKEQRARIREIERDFHVRAFGEEWARVNLDMNESQRRNYLQWMRDNARRHGIRFVKEQEFSSLDDKE